MRPSCKAQIAVTDFFIALFILGILLSFIILAWNTQERRFNEKLEYENMIVTAFQVTDVLVKTEGYPIGWNISNVRVIGLAGIDRIISGDKLALFDNITYDSLRSKLGLLPYHFELVMERLDGTPVYYKGSAFTGDKSVNIKRIVLFDGQEAVVRFNLWR